MSTSQLEAIFRSAHLALKPRTPIPAIEIEFFPFAGLTHTARFRENRLIVRISDLCMDAPDSVIRSLALILLGKLYRRRASEEHHTTYRAFILRNEMQERARNARTQRGRRPRLDAPEGRYQNLAIRFGALNRQYFGGTLERPLLTWSTTRSRRILGRYDATHRMITISLLFDSPLIPGFVIDYVLYHEMLHIKHPSRAQNCRLLTHPPEFRAEERRFETYKKAIDWIKKI